MIPLAVADPSLVLSDAERARFESWVAIDGDCWLWRGWQRSPYGHGAIRVAGRMEQAHRISYRAFVGAIPEGLFVDHLCRVPACVNPSHLEPVTPRVNTMRGDTGPAANARKTVCIHGHPLSGANLRINNRGHRVCVTCNRAEQQRHYAKQRDDV